MTTKPRYRIFTTAFDSTIVENWALTNINMTKFPQKERLLLDDDAFKLFSISVQDSLIIYYKNMVIF